MLDKLQKILNKVQELANLVSGKKTYITAAVGTLSAVLVALKGGHPFEAGNLLLVSSLGATLRAALAKIEKKL